MLKAAMLCEGRVNPQCSKDESVTSVGHHERMFQEREWLFIFLRVCVSEVTMLTEEGVPLRGKG